jgi:hypothetical protein
MSHQLITMLAGIMPEEMLLEQLEEAITKYKISGEIEELGLPCMLISTRIAANKHEGGVTQMIKEMEQMEKTLDLLNPGDS